MRGQGNVEHDVALIFSSKASYSADGFLASWRPETFIGYCDMSL
jgi:hypothetical protein